VPLSASADSTANWKFAPAVKGGGAQTNTFLWGTHADMSLDPIDDCTFWFTGECVKKNLVGLRPGHADRQFPV
jgi:hypothetical protein